MLKNILTFVPPFFVFIPLITGLVSYKYLTKPCRVIFWFALISLISNSIGIVMGALNFHTIFLIHIYTVFEFAFLSTYFAMILGKRFRPVITIVAIVFTVFSILNSLFIQHAFTSVNTYSRSIEAIIVVGYCFFYFLRTADRDEDIEWKYKSLNWVTAGVLLYYSSALFMFIFNNYLLTPGAFAMAVWAAHNLFLLGEYVLFAIGFSKCRSQQTTLTY